jgi:hypothetical protein
VGADKVGISKKRDRVDRYLENEGGVNALDGRAMGYLYGVIIGALRTGLPAIFLSGGPQFPGKFEGRSVAMSELGSSALNIPRNWFGRN